MKLWTTSWISLQALSSSGLVSIALKTGNQTPPTDTKQTNIPKPATHCWLRYASPHKGT
jgi:hypothetical protein